MSRFTQHLTESSGDTPLSEILTLIYQKCQPFLKDIVAQKTQFKYLPYSGRNNNQDHFIKSIRSDRTPKDMNQEVHAYLDNIFNHKFGFKARSNAIFITGYRSLAMGYGSNLYCILPIGNYKFIYSEKIKDLYMAIDHVVGTQSYDQWLHNNLQDYRHEWEMEAEDEWQKIYSEGKKGYWDYDGQFLSMVKLEDMSLSDAKKHVISYINDLTDSYIMHMSLDKYYPNPKDAKKFLIGEIVDHHFNWYPDIDLDEYTERYVDDKQEKFGNEKDYEEWMTTELEKWFEYDHILDTYSNKHIVSAIDSGNEIMLNCNEYLAIREDLYGEAVANYIKAYGLQSPEETTVRNWYIKNNGIVPKQLSLFRGIKNSDIK
jgi:hypothetical protein